MKQRELVVFRTPQHPSLGTNNWGGASPLLARNIPKESLQQRYLKLNSNRNHDEIFPAVDDDLKYLPQTQYTTKHQPPPTRSRRSIAFLSKLISPRKEKEKTTLGSNLKKRWFPIWDPHHRWPQGWC